MRVSGRGVSVLRPHGEPAVRIPPPVADAPGASLSAPEDPTFRTRVSQDRQMVVNVSTRNICEIASTLAPGFTRTDSSTVQYEHGEVGARKLWQHLWSWVEKSRIAQQEDDILVVAFENLFGEETLLDEMKKVYSHIGVAPPGQDTLARLRPYARGPENAVGRWHTDTYIAQLLHLWGREGIAEAETLCEIALSTA